MIHFLHLYKCRNIFPCVGFSWRWSWRMHSVPLIGNEPGRAKANDKSTSFNYTRRRRHFSIRRGTQRLCSLLSWRKVGMWNQKWWRWWLRPGPCCFRKETVCALFYLFLTATKITLLNSMDIDVHHVHLNSPNVTENTNHIIQFISSFGFTWKLCLGSPLL